jgi:hypothetical protein
MPYRHAWKFIVGLLAATLFGFWRSYFSIISTAPLGFHIHGITASLWMLLLLAQSWTPHHGQIAVHRRLGQATFIALPLFGAGAMGVIHSMAVGTVGGDPFYALWGAPLAFIDWLAFGAVLYAVGMALRHRREARLHSAYMLSTALMLLSPVLGRVITKTVPGLIVQGPQDFPAFGWGVQVANLIAGLIALWLWRRDPRAGRPWAVVLGVIVAQIIGFAVLGRSDGWRAVSTALGTQPLGVLFALGFAAGAATVIVGWSSLATRSSRQSAET